MNQQVNLYTDAFRPPKIILPLSHIVALGVATLFLLIVVTFAVQASLASDREALVAQQSKAENMATRLAAMEEEVSLRVQDESLVQANLRLREKIKARKDMMKMLESLVLGDEQDTFSSIMIALARQTSKDLWLKHIQVGASGQTMTLKGTTLNANAVPAYLQRLRSESTFVGRNFTLFNLNVDEDRKNRVHFELTSELSSEQKDAVANAGNALPVMSAGGIQ